MAFLRPEFIDSMSWEMAEVYGAITDQILVNLARYFPYWKSSNVPKSAFEYQAAMLAQMGQVNKDTIRIIRNGLKGANGALTNVLEQAIIEAVKKSEPDLLKAVKQGILKPAGIPIVDPEQSRAFQLYYQQAAQKLNLVNTVMLESTKQAYQATVSDIVSRVQATQTALDIGAGEAVMGVSSWNQALRHSIERMKQNGITGFIDHGGHRWSAEAYTAMDIRTTVANTARAAVLETNQDFGNDLYLVSYHQGARPLCYPWQNKVISANDRSGVTYDLDGNEIEIIPQRLTSYGEPAGLFGINCKHYPTPFIPGVSLIRGEPQDPEANAKTYEESQKQRALEREIREQKRDLLMMKAQGATPEEIKAQRARIRETDDRIDEFCKETGRARRQNREGAYTYRSFPDPDTYDVTEFERTQKEEIEKYFSGGGVQSEYTFNQIKPNVQGESFAESLDKPLSPYSHDARDWDKFLEESLSYKGERTDYLEDVYGKAEVKFRNAPMAYGGDEYVGGQKIDNAVARMFEKTPLLDDDRLILCDYQDAWRYLPNGRDDRRYHEDSFPIAQVFQNKGQTVIAFNRSNMMGTLQDSLEERTRMILEGKVLPTVFPVESPETVVMHEWGHTVYNYYSRALCYSDQDAQGLFDWWKSLTKEEITNGISEYAATNFGEFLAECHAEMQTSNPRPLAVKCFDFMERIISKGYK
jgi:hypothetical protein